MGFGQSVKHVYGNYFTFSGRATRSEFWWFVLFCVIVSIVLNLIDSVIGLHFGGYQDTVSIGGQLVPIDVQGTGILSAIFAIATFFPGLAVAVRRLHDAGHTGWWYLWGALLSIVCCVGAIILLVFYCQGSQPGDNKYGPQPVA